LRIAFPKSNVTTKKSIMKTPLKSLITGLTLLLLATLNPQLSAAPFGTAFTYQGRLIDGGAPATGNYDFWFKLYDAPASGLQQGGTIITNAMPVTNGLFTITLDFGAGAVNGDARWLDIWVHNAAGGSWVWLNPRQPLTPAPHAIYAANAGNVNAANITGTLPNGVLPANPTLAGNVTANTFTGNGNGLTSVNAATVGGLAVGAFWHLTGNAGTTPGVNFLGTTDNQPLDSEFMASGDCGWNQHPAEGLTFSVAVQRP
jgi:hypothetical protein